jgi:hypothetical protein
LMNPVYGNGVLEILFQREQTKDRLD